MNRLTITLLFVLLMWGCQQETSSQSTTEIFEPGVSTGIVEGKKIKEASGIVTSVANPGMLWTHNDSGNAAELFLIDKTGNVKSTVHLPTLKNRDWEEVAVSTEANGKNYVYIGEIGDNDAVHERKHFYKIEEPVLPENVSDTTITQVEVFTFKLSDGARDTEAFFIDPLTKAFYIFSKREHRIKLYKLNLTTPQNEVVAERVLDDLPFTLIVAADISVDGTEILIKNYDNIYYWKREANESIEDALKRSASILPYTPEPQGEAIAFDRSGNGFYTLSEQKKKAPQHLYFYKRK